MSKQHFSDESDGKYFYIMLNMSDDDLDPYEHRLLGHYLRKKSCWETVATTAKITRMSVGKVVKTRNRLQELGYITIDLSEHDTYLISVVDRMQENVERYEALARQKKASSRGEHQIHEVKNDLHEVKNRKFKVLHEVKQRITNQEEQKEEEQKEITTSVPVGTQPALSTDDAYPIALEADDPAMFPVKSKKQISAQADNGAKRLSKPTTTPPPPLAPAPSPTEQQAAKPKRKPSRTAMIIDGVWAKSVSGGLLPMLMGNAKRKPWADYNIEGGMTEIEIFAFARAYRQENPGLNLPEQAAKVWAAIESFRASREYDKWMGEAERQIYNYFPKAGVTPAPVTTEVELATPEELAAFREQIANSALADIFNFKDQTS